MVNFRGGAHVGYGCSRCGFKVGMYVGGTIPMCPSCSIPLQPITGSNAPEALANFKCPHCGTAIGLLLSTSSIKECPHCKCSID